MMEGKKNVEGATNTGNKKKKAITNSLTILRM